MTRVLLSGWGGWGHKVVVTIVFWGWWGHNIGSGGVKSIVRTGEDIAGLMMARGLFEWVRT